MTLYNAVRKSISVYRNHKKAVRIINKLAPHLFAISIIETIICLVLPYISIYLSGLIITNISTAGNINKLDVGKIICLLLISTFVLCVIKSIISNKRTVWENDFYTNFELHLNEMSNSAEYEVLETEAFSVLKEKVRRGNDDDVYGMPLVTTLLCDTVNCFCTMAIAIVLVISVIVRIHKHSIINCWGLLGILSAGFFVLIFLVYLNSKFAKKHNEVGMSFSNKLARLRNYRAYLFHHYMADEKGAAEVRMRALAPFILNEMDDNYLTPMLGVQKQLYCNDKKHEIFVNVISIFLMGSCYFLVGMCALEGLLLIGDVLVCYGSLNRMMQSLMSISVLKSRLDINSEYIQLYFDYKDKCQSSHSGNARIDEIVLDDITIEFNNVCFSYENSDNDVLHNINAVFKSNQRTAIVGPNGSGKTTLIKLLCRLYKPTKGSITINGVNINSLDIYEYYTLLSVVFQDYCLLHFPIGENVATSNLYDEKKVVQSLKDAGFKGQAIDYKKLIATCAGTNFSSDGLNLSGGESQKLAVARSLHKNAPIVILDEPTAALDPIAESNLYQSFDKITEGKTAIYISHRLSSCRFCDKIIVLKDGRIVQQGTHVDLLDQPGGLYADLWNSQAMYYK